jgi:hypothetical protein
MNRFNIMINFPMYRGLYSKIQEFNILKNSNYTQYFIVDIVKTV